MTTPSSAPALGGLRLLGLQRILPPAVYVRRSNAMLLRAWLAHRNAWLSVVSGFFEPLFYLLALGIGLGGVIGDLPTAGGGTVSYAAFIAPGLLAASAMNAAVYETTMSVYFKLRHAKLYESVVATPLGAGDVVLGEVSWAALSGVLYTLGFVVAMAVLSLVSTPWLLAVIPAAFLMAFAFGAVGMAATSYMRSWEDSQLVQLVTVPMLLFSTTFYPLSVYPEWLRDVIRVLPLYQGIDLMRILSAGHPGWNVVPPLIYFAVMTVIGLSVAVRRIDRQLMH